MIVLAGCVCNVGDRSGLWPDRSNKTEAVELAAQQRQAIRCDPSGHRLIPLPTSSVQY